MVYKGIIMDTKEKAIVAASLATLLALALSKRTQASEEGFQVSVVITDENGNPAPTV